MKSRSFDGKRFAVAGLGVSGVSAATALVQLGARVVALDEKPAADGQTLDRVEELQAKGVEVITGWSGRLDPRDFDVLIVSPGFPRSHPVLSDMEGKVWGEVELAWRIARCPIIAITGTNGKSTTTVLAWLLLQAEGVKARLCGNIAGSGYPEQALTKAALEAEADEVLVAEISSFQLENVIGFRPKAAVITNITPDHLDRHPDFEDYRDTKLRIFEQMGEEDTVVVNQSEPLPELEMVTSRASKAVCETFATSEESETIHLGGFKVNKSDFVQANSHFFANLQAAWILASAIAPLGEKALVAAKEFRGLTHRLQMIGERNGVNVINNSMCTNPAAAAASILGVKARQHLILGGKTKGMGEADYRVLREAIGSSHVGYIHGPNATDLNQWLGGRNTVYSSLAEAFRAAVSSASAGEVIHLAPGCASSEPYRTFRERGDDFVRMAKEWLQDERAEE